ncbi:hypothetical protein [Streptomyces sp.]|nr:hypothetical protein [Streptomyces sp.]
MHVVALMTPPPLAGVPAVPALVDQGGTPARPARTSVAVPPRR